jgi:hypothetical protein
MENARVALANRSYDDAVEACEHGLRSTPGCIEARRLWRRAQVGRHETKNRLRAKVMSGRSSIPFIFSSVTKDPMKTLNSAEKILTTDPTPRRGLPGCRRADQRLLREVGASPVDRLIQKPGSQVRLWDRFLASESTHSFGIPPSRLRVSQKRLEKRSATAIVGRHS